MLYLLQGIGDDETGWSKNDAHTIIDNLLADGKVVPMIVVMPNGRASAEPVPANIFDPGQFTVLANFENGLLNDVIPFVEWRYSVLSDRDHRALAGLSMSGGWSLNIGLAHLDRFGWVGGFPSAPNTRTARELVSDLARVASELRMLWISCGDADRLMDISRRFHETPEEIRMPHVWHVDSGGHTWAVWKNDLYLLARRLFKDTATNPAGKDAVR